MELMAPVYPVQLTVALGVSHLMLSRDLQTLNINSAFFSRFATFSRKW